MKRKIFACLFLSLAFFSFHNYEYFLPSGFPKPYIPENNQLTDARIELGKKLFMAAHIGWKAQHPTLLPLKSYQVR